MSDEPFEVAEPFLFIGRTFEEYLALFGLAPSDLADRSVLDCPGGPSSFTAVASTLAEEVRAVDPMYRHDRDRLDTECRDAIERNVAQLREKRDLYVWDYYGDVETRGRYLRAAAERFLADFGRAPDRYLAAGLPDLPLADDAVDLTLSANFLFLYDDRLNRSFHEAAARELLRVTAEEVRLFPLASLDRTRSAYVDQLVGSLREDGIGARFESVDYEFQPGATETLVLEPATVTR